MARLRQLYPANYRTSNNVSAEFESIIRYLVAAERGNKSVAELMKSIFTEDGEFDPSLQFRVDSVDGLQYRIGEYSNGEDGWITIIDIDNLRGPSGSDVGTVESPFFYNRQDVSVTTGQSVIDYAFPEEDMDVLVFKNGVLLAKSDYTEDRIAGQITLLTPLSVDGLVTIGSVRSAGATGFIRSELIASENQAVFPFEFGDEDVVLVYRNGILQRFGGTYDYVESFPTQTVTFMSPLTAGEKVTLIRVQDNSLRRLLGVMTEDKWSDGSGFIPWSKLKVQSGDIEQAKVDGLTSALGQKIRVYYQVSEPDTPETPSLWVQATSGNTILWFYDGSRWNRTTPSATLPDFNEVDAGSFVAVNQTGTGFELTDVDLSSVVPKSWVGASNGVPSLDSTGKIPEGQIPDIYSVQSLSHFKSGAVANETLKVAYVYRQNLKIDGISARVSSGSCSIQLAVDTVGVGPVIPITSTQKNEPLADIVQVDASANGKVIGIIVTNNSSGQNLDIGISAVSRNA